MTKNKEKRILKLKASLRQRFEKALLKERINCKGWLERFMLVLDYNSFLVGFESGLDYMEELKEDKNAN